MGLVTVEYYEHPNLSSYYLEDSYVLDIVEEREAVVFRVEFVLTEDHSQYRAPDPGTQYCYATGSLTFPGVSHVEWAEKDIQVHTDPDGSEDIGNIDYLEQEGSRWKIGGEWGQMLIYTTNAPTVSLDS